MSALYDQIGTTYARYRRADPRIAAMIDAALHGCTSVVSVGAGAGSYEPRPGTKVPSGASGAAGAGDKLRLHMRATTSAAGSERSDTTTTVERDGTDARTARVQNEIPDTLLTANEETYNSVLENESDHGSYGHDGSLRARRVVGLEPSQTMIAQRAPDAAPAVQGVAEHLPFRGGAFDAAIAVLTVHHWQDAQRGLAEMQRVSRRQVVMTWDPQVASAYWLIAEYLPEMAAHESRLTTFESIAGMLGTSDVRVVPVPHDCTDGFMASYWRRPELYLDPDARAAISGITLLDPTIVTRGMRALTADLESGAWHRRHADLLERDEFDAGYRLVIAGS